MAKPDLLAHHRGDAVAVAVRDLQPGNRTVNYLDESASSQVSVTEPVPLGHKVALCNLESGADVIEYGVVIGRATGDIGTGDHVHVHNLKGVRWA